MISREVMAGLEPLVVVWKGSGVRVVVLLSFAVQVTLLALADTRRYFNLGLLKAIIWSAYMLADTAAVYALGHMSLVSKSPEHHLMALWAPLLDNITAYAIEDNQLWLRHLQNFGLQVVAAAYVLHVSTVLGSQTWLRSASIVIFVVGVLKYGERVVALLRARSYANSSLSATSYKDFLSRHKRPATSSVEERTGEELDGRRTYLVELQSIAYTLLDVPKQMFEGPTRYVEIYGARRLRGEDMFKVVLIQLQMMYDLLYTKAAVVHRWYGACIRILSLPATVAALVLFRLHLHASGDKDGGYSYSRADVVATYVLLGGALVVETTSVVRAMCASWTCALLVKAKWVRLARELHRLGGLVTWKAGIVSQGEEHSENLGSMGQHNLFRLCRHSRKKLSSKIAAWMGWDDCWDSVANYWSILVREELIQAVVQLVSRSKRNQEFDVKNSRGRTALSRWDKNQGCNEELFIWSVELDLDESILVWHIATHLCNTWLHSRDGRRVHPSITDLEVVTVLSNYMFFLLATRPYMLPYPVSRQRYVQLCHDVITSPVDQLGSIEGQVRAWDGTESLALGESDWNETLQKGCRLAKDLLTKRTPDITTVHMIRDVWVEMLCYAAYRCNENFHAKHLNDGGELMTIVALFMLYYSKDLIDDTSPAADTHTTYENV